MMYEPTASVRRLSVWRGAALAAALLLGCGDSSAHDAGGGGSTSDGGGPGSGGSTTNETGGNGGSGSGASGQGGGGSSSGGGGSGGAAMSAGCGLDNPASGDLTIDVEGQTGLYRVSLPSNYDPSNPYPLGFAFHGSGRTGPQCQEGDCAGFQTVMQEEAVLVYMTSLGGPGWDAFDLNSTFFSEVLDQMLAAYCIDPDRVFAAGTSSGAHFSNVVGCRFGDRLLAIAPVAGYLPEQDCVDHVAALVIHGISDYHVPFENGEEARDFWRTQNGCSDETIPTIAEVHATVSATPESHACATYQGCDAELPVVWCEHSEGGYDGSTHGWPLFGGQAIWDFVSAL